jgi:hypothetical protein
MWSAKDAGMSFTPEEVEAFYVCFVRGGGLWIICNDS